MQMSEVYREDTRDENGSDDPDSVKDRQGSCDNDYVGIETDDFVWGDALEEICRFENFSVDMAFKSCSHFSQSLVIFMAKRLLDKVSLETNPESKQDNPDSVKDCRPSLDMDAKRSSDVNVTVRSRASNRVEQETVESGNEDIGSSMQRIGSILLHVVAAGDHSNKKEATTTRFSIGFIACGSSR